MRNEANGETGLANAPFTAKDAAGKYTAGSELTRVQYGRVTSKLHGVFEKDLKDGKDVAQYGTKVASSVATVKTVLKITTSSVV